MAKNNHKGGESLPLAPKPSRFTTRSCKQDEPLSFVGLSATPSSGGHPRNAPEDNSQEIEGPYELFDN